VFVWLSETTNFVLCSIKRLGFITEVEIVYYAVRTKSLYRVSHSLPNPAFL